MSITTAIPATGSVSPNPAAIATRSYSGQAARRLAAVTRAAKQTAGLDVLDHVALACLIGAGHAAISTDHSGRGIGYLTAAARALDEHRGDPLAVHEEIALIDALLAACHALAGGPAEQTAVHLGRAAAEFDRLPEQDALIPRALLALAYALAAKAAA
jgi:hypothetical protein